jgi:hypothetical protein
MSYGLINTGSNKKNLALSGFRDSAKAENQRNIANNQLEQAERAQRKTNAGMGASTGATIGATMASNMGLGAASIGASALASGGIGLAAGLLLSELF